MIQWFDSITTIPYLQQMTNRYHYYCSAVLYSSLLYCHRNIIWFRVLLSFFWQTTACSKDMDLSVPWLIWKMHKNIEMIYILFENHFSDSVVWFHNHNSVATANDESISLLLFSSDMGRPMPFNTLRLIDIFVNPWILSLVMNNSILAKLNPNWTWYK